MSVIRVRSAILSGLDVQPIGVEVDVRRGLPNFTVVGLAKDAVKESRDRVIAAVRNSGFEMPAMKVTVNLTPVSLRKESSLLDLPIAVGLLAAGKQIPPPPDGTVFLGELSLDGALQPAAGMMALLDGLSGASPVVIPADNAADASMVAPSRGKKSAVRLISRLSDLAAPVDHLPVPARVRRRPSAAPVSADDFADVRGQHLARRAAEIAAAGGHHLILIGPPGTGKSMLSRRIPSILPALSPRESVTVTKLFSVAGILSHPALLRQRPFRSPHHTLSDVAMIGGGPDSRPGEISLAHGGVLFLDEFPEFRRSCLEALRQPIEERTVLVSRAAAKVTYPADFILVCAMNPCPCGYAGHPVRPCRCTSTEIRRYFNKLSGPILNRIDLQVELSPESPDLMLDGPPGESSDVIRKRVIAARRTQEKRTGRDGGVNSQLSPAQTRQFAPLSAECNAVLQAAFRRMNFSPRAVEKVIKVARTIADLAGAADIAAEHLLEAVRFRALDMLTSR